MIARNTLGLVEAEKALKAMTEEASKGGRPVSMAVLDAWGELISFARMDGASPLTARMAMNKAFSKTSTCGGSGCIQASTTFGSSSSGRRACSTSSGVAEVILIQRTVSSLTQSSDIASASPGLSRRSCVTVYTSTCMLVP